GPITSRAQESAFRSWRNSPRCTAAAAGSRRTPAAAPLSVCFCPSTSPSGRSLSEQVRFPPSPSSSGGLSEELVHEGDCHAAFADCCCDALHGAESDVAAGEDARDACLKEVGVAVELPPFGTAHVGAGEPGGGVRPPAEGAVARPSRRLPRERRGGHSRPAARRPTGLHRQGRPAGAI